MAHILTVSGSPSVVSRSARLLAHVGERLLGQGHVLEHLSIRDLPAEALLHADFGHPAIVATLATLEGADAVVIATPV